MKAVIFGAKRRNHEASECISLALSGRYSEKGQIALLGQAQGFLNQQQELLDVAVEIIQAIKEERAA